MKIETHNTTSTLAEAVQAKAEARLLLEENGLLRQALADAGKCIDADDVIDALDAVDEYAEALGTQTTRIAELEEALSGLLKTFEGVGFRIGLTHPPHTASYDEAEQYYATNYQGETALFMFQQWCRWKLVRAARAALKGEKS